MKKLLVLVILTIFAAPAFAATQYLLPMPKLQFFDNAGRPLAGGKIYTCVPGTSCGPGSITMKPTYADRLGNSTNPNPVVLDSAGRANIWGSQSYKVAVYDAAGQLVYTQDNVNGGPSAASGLPFVGSIDGQIILGVTPGYGSIKDAIATLNGTKATVYLQSNVTLSESYTVPSSMEIIPLNGAVITVGAGKTFTYQGTTARWPSTAMFDVSSGGNVVLTGASEVNPEWCNASADSAKIQWAVNTALASGAMPVTVPRKYDLSSATVNIDRMVDTTTSEFRIIGKGPSAGFYTSAALPMFSSTFAVTAAPLSENVTFEDITFTASSSALAATVATQKFLRIKFNHCYFNKIKCVDAAIYLQQWEFINGCKMVGWKGGWFVKTADTGYAITCDHSTFEGGGSGFKFHIAYGCAFTNSTFEGSSDGGFLQFDGFNGVQVSGNYLEQNYGTNFIFTDVSNGSTGSGLTFTGNQLQSTVTNSVNASFWDVVWGNVSACFSAGNSSNARLHDDLMTPLGGLISAGDNSYILNRSGNPLVATSMGVIDRSGSITAHVGGGQLNAVLLTKALNRVTSSGVSGTDSVKLPPAVGGGRGLVITVINDSPYAIQVFGSGTDSINFTAASTGVSQPSLTTRTYYNSAASQWSY